MRRRFTAAAMLALMVAAGCDSPAPPPRAGGAATPSAADKPLVQTILVIDDPELATGIGLLRGEWNARSGHVLEVRTATLAETRAAGKLDADVVCYPARLLGELATRGWLRPLRTSVLESQDFAADDFLPLIRHRAMIYDGQAYAAPLGCQLLFFGYRRSQVDAWERLPETYEQLLRRLEADDQAVLHVAGVDHPHRLAELFLAVAASQVAGETLDSLLFDPTTMRPTIETAPFVRGLEVAARLARRLPPGDASPIGSEPLAWTEPPAAAAMAPVPDAPPRPVTPAESRLTVLCLGGPVVNVTSTTRNTAAAFRLLAWLASGDQAAQIVRKHGTLLPCRESLLPTAGAGQGRARGWAAERAELAAAALTRDRALRVPRIPGIDDYLAALTEAVEQVAGAQREPAAALAEAVARWEAITDGAGRDAQRAAYLRHLELP